MATPYVSREGKRAARQADRRAGMGGWKKRTPSCNGVDRGCAHRQYHPTRKRADVPLVWHHQRAWPTSVGEKADDGSGNTDWCTLRPDDGPEAPSAYGEGWATARCSPWHNRVPQGALARLELLEGKLSRAVLRGLSGSNPARLPGTRHARWANGPYFTKGCQGGWNVGRKRFLTKLRGPTGSQMGHSNQWC